VPGLANKVGSVTAANSTITIGGTATAPTVAVNAVAESQVTNLSTDLAAKTPTSRQVTAGTGLTGGGDLTADRSFAVAYGTTAATAAVGNDARLSDTRTPTAGSVVDASVSASAAIAESKLALASDAAAGTASRRTLGTGAQQAAAGNDSRIVGAAPAASPTLTGTTTVARVVYAPVTVTYAATTTIDASLGNHFRITLTGNLTLATPTNPADGQNVLLELVQDATGGRTVTLPGNFNVITSVTGPVTFTTTASTRSYLGATYRSSGATWDLLAFATGVS
jgi:hypothetical protein